MGLEMRAEPGQLRRRSQLPRLQRAKARILEGKGEDEGEHPEAEVGQAHRESDAQSSRGRPRSPPWPQGREGEAREVHRGEERGVERSRRQHSTEEQEERSGPPSGRPANAGWRSPDEDRHADHGDGQLG